MGPPLEGKCALRITRSEHSMLHPKPVRLSYRMVDAHRVDSLLL
jgi:hypothetical protein